MFCWKNDRSSLRAASGRPGLTLIELLACLTALAVLVGVLLPAVQGARAVAATTNCQNHLKQIGLAIEAVEPTYGTAPPLKANEIVPGLAPALETRAPAAGETSYAATEFTTPSVWRCPAASPFNPEWGNFSYLMNGNLRSWSDDSGALDRMGRLRVRDWPDGKSQTVRASERLLLHDSAVGRGFPVYQDFSNRYGETQLPFYSTTAWREQSEIQQFVDECNAAPFGQQPFTTPEKRLYGYFSGDDGYDHVMMPNGRTCMSGLVPEFEMFNTPEQHWWSSIPATSFHAGGVNMLYADGAVKLTSESIDITPWRAIGSAESYDVASF